MTLAKSYRWTNDQKEQTPPLVDQGLAILKKINASSLPKGTSKEKLEAQIMGLKIAVISLSKDYDAALKLNTQLIKKMEPGLISNATQSSHISDQFNSFYNQAVLYEKLGKKQQAQAKLQKLLTIIDEALVKFPNDPGLLNFKKVYGKHVGKEIK